MLSTKNLKLILFLFCLRLCPLKIFSQTTAIIPTTLKEVILFDNGTWKFANNSDENSPKINNRFSRPTTSDFLVKGQKLKYGIWVNKNKWSHFKIKPEENSPAEYKFRLNGEDAYGMVIPEKIKVPLEFLVEYAVDNARKIAPDVEITAQEDRVVNGINVRFIQLEGHIEGVNFVYLSYYYSSDIGVIQFITYTAKNLWKQYQRDMENLLNGMVILPQ